ncbi:hypothetical protein WR25_23022 [Diploscapter pachys]|uniref:Cytochrome b5 heme-binding domain-containing protein n=1 Tax=Diploscapter pachys TaxID=2018661 RepID=A0A2A2LSQ4_9BILA|nr:hypothetical protein WR25_23022 [Diploscapter pachys]
MAFGAFGGQPAEYSQSFPKTDFTMEELKEYDGVKSPNIFIAVNKTIFDVTPSRDFYGPGTAYGCMAGRDGTRVLSMMDKSQVKDEWDEYSDFTDKHRESLASWETFFHKKYRVIGKLVKSAGDKTNYQGAEAKVEPL